MEDKTPELASGYYKVNGNLFRVRETMFNGNQTKWTDFAHYVVYRSERNGDVVTYNVDFGNSLYFLRLFYSLEDDKERKMIKRFLEDCTNPDKGIVTFRGDLFKRVFSEGTPESVVRSYSSRAFSDFMKISMVRIDKDQNGKSVLPTDRCHTSFFFVFRPTFVDEERSMRSETCFNQDTCEWTLQKDTEQVFEFENRLRLAKCPPLKDFFEVFWHRLELVSIS